MLLSPKTFCLYAVQPKQFLCNNNTCVVKSKYNQLNNLNLQKDFGEFLVYSLLKSLINYFIKKIHNNLTDIVFVLFLNI